MHKGFIAAGALIAALGVATGAFGAHGLQKITSDTRIIQSYQTAVQYQLYHAVALIITGMLFTGGFSGSLLKKAATCFITGIILFSGSIYGLTVLKINDSDLTKLVGPVTPVGGLFFIAGWLLLMWAVLRRK